MKQYIVYFIDYKNNDKVTLKSSFSDKELANDNIELQALQYVTELQGSQQRDICKQNKTAEEILNDFTLRDGLYFQNMNDQIVLYEKLSKTVVGWIQKTQESSCNKIGVFGLTELDLNIIPMSKCTNIPPPPSTRSKKINAISQSPDKKSTDISVSPMNFVDELRMKQTLGEIKLKHVGTVEEKIQYKPITLLDELVNNDIKLKHVTTVEKSIFDFGSIIVTEDDNQFFDETNKDEWIDAPVYVPDAWERSSGMPPQDDTDCWNINITESPIWNVSELSIDQPNPSQWVLNPIYPDIDFSDMPELEDSPEEEQLISVGKMTYIPN